MDEDAPYTVMCLWASSEHGPLSIIPAADDVGRAQIRDIQIYLDRESLRLTSVALRVEDTWSGWDEDAGGEAPAPVFRVEGNDFSLDGTLSGPAGTHEVTVAGSCETSFD